MNSKSAICPSEIDVWKLPRVVLTDLLTGSYAVCICSSFHVISD